YLQPLRRVCSAVHGRLRRGSAWNFSGHYAARRCQDPPERHMTNGFGGGKANDVHLKVAQNSVLETINEPVHGQLTTVHPGIAQKRGTAKISDLEDHIDFAELFCALDRI